MNQKSLQQTSTPDGRVRTIGRAVILGILIVAPLVVTALVVAAARNSRAITIQADQGLRISEMANALRAQGELISTWIGELPRPRPGRPAPIGPPPPPLERNPQMVLASERFLTAAAYLARAANTEETALLEEAIRVYGDFRASYIRMSADPRSGDSLFIYLHETQPLETELRSLFEDLRAESQSTLQLGLDRAVDTNRLLGLVAPFVAVAGLLAGIYMVRFHNSRRRADSLYQTVEDKNQFIGSISHELRTPLTAIIGFCEELQDGDDLDEETRRELLGLVLTQSIEMRDIVEDLLVAERTDTGTVSIVTDIVDLGAIALQVVDDNPLTEALPEIIADLADTSAIGDPIRIRQIVRNLYTNAVRYGGEQIELRVGTEYGTAFVDLVDNGGGVPADDVARIFEPYETTGTQAPGSVGLGLWISRALARLMDGDLVYRRLDDKTIFRLTLPAAPDISMDSESMPTPIGDPVRP